MDAKNLFDQEYAARLARAAQETLRAQLDLARRSADLARSTLAGETSVADAGREYVKALGAEGVRLGTQTGDLVRLYLERVGAVGASVVGSAFGGSGSDRSAATSRGRSADDRTTDPGASDPGASDSGVGDSGAVPGAPTEPTEPTGTDVSGAVSLHGPLGGTAAGSVVVVNRHPRKRVVLLAADPLTDGSGAECAAALVIEPRRVTVPAGAEETITLRVGLVAGEVEPGGTYRTVLRISGAQEASVQISVRVDD